LDRLLTVSVTLCAILAIFTLVRQNLAAFGWGSSARLSTQAPAAQTESRVENWKRLLEIGTRIGRTSAPIQVVEFADFECPACRRLHEAYSALPSGLRDSVALTYVHFPLSYHRYAIPAARVSECAGQQGRFAEMHDALYGGQQSFGVRAWLDFAREAGVLDSAAFSRCAAQETPVPAVQTGLTEGRALRVDGTPTLIVNGWRVDAPLDTPRLAELLRAYRNRS